ncbi:MAG: hypothetical protein ABIG71_00985 [Candidatus Uhrbacteria bacterium]
MSTCVRRTLYGSERNDETPNVILTCPHDGGPEAFLGDYPIITRVCPADLGTLMRYLAVERDTGASALAHRIASLIANQTDHRAAVIEVLLPRGIVDGNRVTGCAIRNVFHHHAHSDLTAQLRELHTQVLQLASSYVSELEPNGILLDIHTMAPYTPFWDQESATMAVKETPDALSQYVDVWINPTHRHKRRMLDVVTRCDDDNILIADSVLRDACMRQLTNHDIAWRENDPYFTSNHIVTTNFMRAHRAIALDVPKDYLSELNAEDDEFDPTALTIDNTKLSRIAQALADAAIETLDA